MIAEKLENGENITLNDEIVKSILESVNADNSNPYYKELQDDKIITPSGYEILYSDLYTNSGTGSSNIKEYTSDGVPIPKGFYYVGGTKSDGVVISDNSADEGKGTSHQVAQTLQGNQFVWVPVVDEDFKRYEGYSRGQLQSYLENSFEPNTTNGYAIEEEEFNAMKDSVLKYDGFYVARYEASNENGKVASKQGKTVWNNISWGNSMTDIGTTGAVYKSQQMYTDKNTYGVTSTLIYGVQWDAIMQWIDPGYKNEDGTLTSYVADSTGKGYYNASAPTVTGSNADYAVKNIYDLAGNVTEWTMESFGTSYRGSRGGDYNYNGSNVPASIRIDSGPDYSVSSIGFRSTLYLEN